MVSEGMERAIKMFFQQGEIAAKKRVEENRANMNQLAAMLQIPKDVKIEKVDINGVPAIWVSTPDVVEECVVLYLHGGGYVMGSINTHKEFGSRISRVSNSRVLLLDYHRAPENSYPAALDDAVAAYKWLIDSEGINPKNIIIGGESAGGGLTIATLLNLRDTGITLPTAAIILSPWADLLMTGETIRTKAKVDPLANASDLFFYASLYVGEDDPKNPYISPLYADLKGLPPMLIQVGSAEVLLSDSIRIAEKAKTAGVDVLLDIWEDMIHMFQMFALWAPEGQKATEKIGEFIQKHLKKEVQII
ncbi:MAG: alpha/beta hydrolase [Candidatus Lokiarchaeota archaeon]|nr:alpha/beta hydrolase [Candidatus Lokiarchaeota archaeon]